MTVHADLPPVVRRFGIQVVASVLDVTPSAISQWRKVPLSRVVILATTLQITPAEIRPDLFALETTIDEAARYQLQHDPQTRARATLHLRKKFKEETVTIRTVEWQEINALALAAEKSPQKTLRHQRIRTSSDRANQ